jgi:hypothetical protein
MANKRKEVLDELKNLLPDEHGIDLDGEDFAIMKDKTPTYIDKSFVHILSHGFHSLDSLEQEDLEILLNVIKPLM